MAWAWTPGTYPAGSYGFGVDTQNRNDVVAFYQGVYKASEGYWDRHGWTGDYAGNAGTMSAAFTADTERRINYYRAMCGLGAGVRLNTNATVLIESTDPYKPAATLAKSEAARLSAYMLIRTWGYFDYYAPYQHAPLGNAWAAMSHSPSPLDCVGWSEAAWNGNYRGNLALGFYGPGAVDNYISEEPGAGGALTSAGNVDTGHRRWLLYPVATVMATGDTPGWFDSMSTERRLATNSLYVVQKTSEKAVVTPAFTSFPPAGYFPAPLNSKYWSVTYPGANFATAAVSVTSNGSPVAVTVVARNGNYAEPALVWEMGGAAAAKSVAADTTYQVSVTGISGSGVPTSVSYQVTLINPGLISPGVGLLGTATPSVANGAAYRVTPPSKAEALQVNAFQASPSAWVENAEDGNGPNVTPDVGNTYPFISTVNFPGSPPNFTPVSGAKSFRLTHPVWYDPLLNRAPDASFELNQVIIPQAGGTLYFSYRRGYMGDSMMVVEKTTDDGATWVEVAPPIPGPGSNNIDPAPTAVAWTLGGTGVPTRLRFRYHFEAGTMWAAPAFFGTDYSAYPTGIFLDDIHVGNCLDLNATKYNDLAGNATSFTLDATTAGLSPSNNQVVYLRSRAKLGNRWMPHGDLKTLTYSNASQTAAPVFTPAAGTYAAGQAITIAGESGSVIHYSINGGAEQSAASPVSGITVPALPSSLSIAAYAEKTGKTGSGVVAASYMSSRYSEWMATYFPGSADPAVTGATADPDHDGQNNLLEFALGGNPSGASSGPRVAPLASGSGPAQQFLLTIAVRSGTPAFSGSPSPSATMDGITYTVLGGADLTSTSAAVSVVAPATTGLPAAPAGYEYRTFRLGWGTGLSGKGFMRVKVSGTL